MNPILFIIIIFPILEIYIFIKIGSEIGAFSTILLIFITAVVGMYYAKYEGLNTLKSGFIQLNKKEIPTYEVISGASIAIGAIFLIIPGFATDIVGFFLIFPISRKIILSKLEKKYKSSNKQKKNFIEGEFEDIEEDNDKKI